MIKLEDFANPSSKQTFWKVFLFAFAVLAVSTVGLEVTKIDIRFALMVQDMASNGVGIFPTVNGVEYCDYFSTWVFFSYLTTFGGRFVNLFTLTLPTMLCGAYILAMTYILAERLKAGAGIFAFLLSVVTYEYIMSFTTFGLDIPVAAASVTMLYLFTSKDLTGPATLAVFAGLLVAVFAVRGPLGLILTGAAAGGCLIAGRRWKGVILYGLLGAAAAVICGVGIYYLIHRSGGRALWDTFYAWQIGGKVSASKYAKTYYFTNAMGSFAPVSICGIAFIVFNFKRLWRNRDLGGLFGYIILPMLVMSIPGCKHLRYITLVLPAFAAFGGVFVSDMIERYGERMTSWRYTLSAPRAAGGVFMAAFAGLFTAAAFILPSGGIACLQLVTGVAVCAVIAKHAFPDAAGAVAGVLCAVGIFVTLGLIPFMISLEGAHNFVSRAEALRDGGKVYLFELGPDHDDLKYVYNVPPSVRGDIVYSFLKPYGGSEHLTRMYPYELAEESLKKITSSDVVVTSAKRYARLKKYLGENGFTEKNVLSGRFGHRLGYAVQVSRKEVSE